MISPLHRLVSAAAVVLSAGLVCAQPDKKPDDRKPGPDPPPPELAKLVRQVREQVSVTDALKKLKEMGADVRPATRELLEALTYNRNRPEIQRGILEVLEKANPTVYKPVVTLLLDNGWFERADALKAVEKLKKEDRTAAFPAVLYAYHKDRIQSKGEGFLMGDFFRVFAGAYPEEKDTREAFLQAITYAGPRLPATAARKAALENLGKVKLDPRLLFKALVSATGDRDVEVRAAAIKELGNLGAEARSVLPALKTLKLDRDKKIRDAATEAVQKIEGKM